MDKAVLDASFSIDAFFDLTPDILVIADYNGYFLKVNAAFERVLGYTADEALSRPYVEFVHPDDRQRTTETTEPLVRGEDIEGFENRYRHKDGSWRVIRWSSKSSADGKTVFGIGRDVTRERSTRNQLEQIDNTLSEQTILAWTDPDGVITRVNRRFCEVSGYSEDELIGQTHRLVNSGSHEPGFFEGMWKTITAGRIWTGLIKNRRKDGSFYWVHTVISPIRDIEGEIEQYLAVRFETTRFMELQEEYRRVLKVLNHTGAMARVGGWELAVTGELTWTDETFRMFGVEKTQGATPNLSEAVSLYTEEHRPIVEQAVRRCLQHGEPYSLEIQAKNTNGEIFWVATNGQANIVDGEIRSIYGSIQDINARKQAEVRYEQERLKSIHAAKLASLGEMAAGVAHEINNPLAVVIGSTQVMPRHLDDPQLLLERIEAVEKSAHRIERIVSSLRKFSRSGEGHLRERQNLVQLIAESIRLAATRARSFDANVSYHGPEEAWIECDEVEIEQVFINLLNNAVDAVKDLDTRRVEVRLQQEGHTITVSVSDSGDGLPAELRERVFEPFFTTKRDDEGTGLGLSITKGILDEHGASITIDPDADHTRFVLTFPVAA